MLPDESFRARDVEASSQHAEGKRLAGSIATPILLAVALLTALNFSIFRLFDYYYWVKPNSTMGSVVQTENSVKHQIVDSKKNVIVLGDSRVSEGFSSEIANASSHRPDLNFIQSGIPGSSPVVWFYLLRKIDPQKNHFAAIVLMVPRFDDQYEKSNLWARDDLTYLQPITRFGDAFAVANGYPSAQKKLHALAAIWLPMLAAREDFLDFAADPKKRIADVELWHSDLYKWVSTYQGHAGQLPTLGNADFATFKFATTGLSKPQLNQMDNYLQHIEGSDADSTFSTTSSYRRKWYGAIAKAYRRAGVPVFVFQVPRGPYEAFAKAPDATASSGAIPTLAREKKLIALDATPFEALERPEYFFDALHLNSAGRMLMSPVLAGLVAKQLPESH